jgi:hypothetical protein
MAILVSCSDSSCDYFIDRNRQNAFFIFDGTNLKITTKTLRFMINRLVGFPKREPYSGEPAGSKKRDARRANSSSQVHRSAIHAYEDVSLLYHGSRFARRQLTA